MGGNTGDHLDVEPQVNIDIWSDIACPWCLIGKRRFDKALAAFPHRGDVTVTWHSYQLDPTLPEHDDRTEAEYLAASKGMPVEQVRQMFAHVAKQAAAEGITIDFDSLVVANSMKAHQLIQLAKEQDAATVERLEEALFLAHFEQGRDIGDAETLVRIGTAAGLGEQAIREELATGSRIPAVRADVEHGVSLGLNSVPTFILNMKYAVPGAQSVEVFTQALNQAWEEAHPVLQNLVSAVGMGDSAAVGGADGTGDTNQGGTGASCGPDGCAL